MTSIFLIPPDEALLRMTAQPYDTEELLQQLLARYPDVLAADADPRGSSWLLVSREVPIPDAPESTGRWALDHLFLDRDGVPTFVEVKRKSDTRLRREVVGQMLDYAANALSYWPPGVLQSLLAERCQAEGLDYEGMLRDHLGPEPDIDGFWRAVNANLEDRRVRLVFVADEIPTELQAIIEYLNEQMKQTDVFAIEVRQYVGEGGSPRVLAPRVIGFTAKATEVKRGRERPRQWDRDSFFAELARAQPKYSLARKAAEWADADGELSFGRGAKQGTMHVRANGFLLCSFNTNGNIEFDFKGNLTRIPAFADEPGHQRLLARINAVPGLDIPEERLQSWSGSPASEVEESGGESAFLQLLDWLRVHAATPAA